MQKTIPTDRCHTLRKVRVQSNAHCNQLSLSGFGQEKKATKSVTEMQSLIRELRLISIWMNLDSEYLEGSSQRIKQSLTLAWKTGIGEESRTHTKSYKKLLGRITTTVN